MKATDILNGAADLIERNGKSWGRLYSAASADTPLGDRPMCALGAIAWVAVNDPTGWHSGAAAKAVVLLRDSLGIPDHGKDYSANCIGDWSDGNSATAVIAQLRLVADNWTNHAIGEAVNENGS